MKTDMTTEEVIKEILEKEEKLRSFRFGFAGAKSKNVKEGAHLKKDIARLKTMLNKK